MHRPGFIVVFALLLLGAGVALWGCGGPTEGTAQSSTTAGPTSTTSVPGTGLTTPPVTGGTTSPETTVFTGTTGPGGQMRTLTFLGAVSQETWRALRVIVTSDEGEGQRVLDDVAALATGPSVDVGVYELDAVSGIGFAAGASTSQPIGAAVDEDGNQIMVFAYTVTGEPDATTIVGYERQTNHVELVVGPLPISDSTGNITTIP